MPAVEESIIIERSPETVFRFTTDPRNVPRYSRNVVDYEKLEGGPMEVGTRVGGTVRVAGDGSTRIRGAGIRPAGTPRRQDGRVAHPFRMTQRYEAAVNGTRLDWLTESDGFGGFFGRLTESVVVSMYARDLRSDLESLKRLIETETL